MVQRGEERWVVSLWFPWEEVEGVYTKGKRKSGIGLASKCEWVGAENRKRERRFVFLDGPRWGDWKTRFEGWSVLKLVRHWLGKRNQEEEGRKNFSPHQKQKMRKQWLKNEVRQKKVR